MASALQLKQLWQNGSAGKALIMGTIFAAALLLFFACLTWREVGLWRAGEKRDMAVLARRSVFAAGFDSFMRANALIDRGELEQGLGYYRESLKINPDYVPAYNNMGVILARSGRLNEATAAFREALRIKPEYAEGHYHLGLVLSMLGKSDEAIEHYRRALSLRPGYAEAQRGLDKALGESRAR